MQILEAEYVALHIVLMPGLYLHLLELYSSAVITVECCMQIVVGFN